MRKRTLVIGLIVVVLVVLPFTKPAQALFVTVNVLIPDGSWRPLQLVSRSPERLEDTIHGPHGRSITIHQYWPRGRSNGTGLIIYTPFIGGGVGDERLVNIAETFARAGFVVVVPTVERDVLTVTTDDIDVVVTTTQWLRGQSQGQAKVSGVGLFGISYGTGPVFAAASEETLRDSIPFIVALNGFYDLDDFVHFVRTGEYEYGQVRGELEPHEYTHEILQNTLVAHGSTDLSLFLQSRVYADLQQQLSPAEHISDITSQVFIIHSTDDRFIPYTESMRLHDRMQEHGRDSMLVLTDVVEHGTYREMTWENLRSFYVPAFLDFYRLTRQVIAAT